MHTDVVRGLRIATVCLVGLAWPAGAPAQQRAVDAPAPGSRPLQHLSLSAEEIRGLREGEGLGLARPAELNGYPGPADVLEMAREGKIHLYAEQRQAIERVYADTKAKARALGEQILAEEAQLEAGFRAGHIIEAELARRVGEIGQKRAELRLAYLRAHLLTTSLLRPDQVEEFYQVRGFTVPSPRARRDH